MATNNGHYSRQGQHNNNNKNRNRNRNRRHGGGGSSHLGGGGGGSPGNRVFDSNGPDVKLRGTAQTIAEKYMQLGRDAQLSGDNVMSESYYQHGEHYYRLWLANQPVGQPIQFGRRPGEDGYEDEQGESSDGDEEGGAVENAAEAREGNEPSGASEDGDPNLATGEGQVPRQQQRPRDQNRDTNRDGGRERFRPRWPKRSDRPEQVASGEGSPERDDSTSSAPEVDAGNWETPSFLTRPVAAPMEDDVPTAPEAQAERRPRREARSRRPREAEADTPGSDTPPDKSE